jgi:uncharacterized protein YqjF (DUF2071 family)
MLNYDLDPALVRPLVPAGLDLDSWRGRAFVSLVGFQFLDTRVRGRVYPGHRDFDEVNLRFYVRRRVAGGRWRRGVTFVKEIVPRWAIAAVARLRYGEPYVRLPMRHEIVLADGLPGEPACVRYAWRHHRRWHGLELEVGGPPASYAPGSEEEFIAEHYWGYAQRRGRTTEYRVEHPPWRIWPAARAAFHGDARALYGPELGGVLSAAPASAFLAEGSPVTVYTGTPIEPDQPPTAAA